MTLFENFLIIAALICTFSGCANISMDSAEASSAVSASSDSRFSDAESTVGGTIYFDYDKYDLSSSATSEMRDFARTIASNSSRIRIEGHCDERGTIEYNLALGEKRANTVAEFLQVNGVSSSRITVVSYGEEKPVSYGSDESSWSKNRRAVIKIY